MAEKRPLIALSAQYRHDEPHHVRMTYKYMDAVMAAGGAPVCMPVIEDESVIDSLVESIDGLIITGGVDVDPRMYGELALTTCGMTTPNHDRMMISMVNKMIAANKPVLGICRGLQVLNVALGGTLYQDIQTQCPGVHQHFQQTFRDELTHTVLAQEGSLLHRFFGKAEMGVNSLHHQVIKDLASDLVATAHSKTDGLIEAAEHKTARCVFGVQWHPEELWQVHPEHKAIFEHFIQHCK